MDLTSDGVPDEDDGVVRRRSNLAIDLEDTAVVIAPPIPWSIAGAVPLATINAPASSLAAAPFLYLIPVCRLGASIARRRRPRRDRVRDQ